MSRDLSLAFIVILAIFGLCFGAVKAHTLTPPPPTPPIATASAPGAAEVKPAGPVVMHVNGEPVTAAEFSLFLQSLPQQYQQMAANPAVRREIADQFVRMKVLEQEARKLGADRDPDVAAKMSFGHTNVLLEYALKKLQSAPNEAALRAEYEKAKAQIPNVTTLAHIVVAYQGGQLQSRAGQTPPPQIAMQQAAILSAKIKGGMPFEQAAEQYSDDEGSYAQGGKIGDIEPGQLPPELQQVIDKVKPGDITGPVRSQLGIHIFKVLGRHTATYEDVKPALVRKLQQEKVQNDVERLQKSARVEFDPKYFPASGGRPGSPMPMPDGAVQPQTGRPGPG